MIRHIVWQATLALLGVALVFGILFQLRAEDTIPEETVVVPRAGGAYIEGVVGYSETINPILAPALVQGNPVDQDLSALVFDGLTTLGEGGQVAPALATNWDVSEDGKIYEFQLRRDVVWHDEAPFTAADVAFTVQAMQDPNFQGDPTLRELWRDVVVEQLDSFTVRFTLAEPFASFLYYSTIGILPAHLLSDVAAADLPSLDLTAQQPVGTGRFMLESALPDRIVLAANPNSWEDVPLVDNLEFWFYADESSLLQDYERGALHGFHPARPESLVRLSTLPELQLYTAPSTGYGLVYLNLQRDSVAFLQQTEVRQALLYGLDRQALIDRVLAGQGLVASSPIPPTVWGHDPSVRHFGYDPERAIGLLDAAGWIDSDGDGVRDTEGAKLHFTLLTTDDMTMVQMADELAEQWGRLGIEVDVRAVSPDTATQFILSRSFDAALVELGLTADPDPYPLWHSTQAGDGGQNFSGYSNEDVDVLLEDARSTVDDERRADLYGAFQRLFAEDVPSLLIYYPIYTYAVDSQVQELQLRPLLQSNQRFDNIADWYIQTEEVVVKDIGELDTEGE